MTNRNELDKLSKNFRKKLYERSFGNDLYAISDGVENSIDQTIEMLDRLYELLPGGEKSKDAPKIEKLIKAMDVTKKSFQRIRKNQDWI